MIFRSGLLLSFWAVLLQIAVFLQPLLPEHYQISPVCETITRALLLPSSSQTQQQYIHHDDHQHDNHQHHDHGLIDQQHPVSSHQHDHHDANHQCQYCTVYANLVLPPELGIQEVLERIQIRLLFFKRQLAHVYFILQRLFLLPQGRAPPVFA